MLQNNTYSPDPRNYSKSNFADLLELITPKLYVEDDISLSGLQVNPISELINSHLSIADNIDSVLSLSATTSLDINTLSGISSFFVKQNNLTNITPETFFDQILFPLGFSYSDFTTSGDFENYLSSNLLPKIIPPGANTQGTIENNISELSALSKEATASSINNYLVESLGWFYFLNTSALGGLSYSPSSFVLENLSKVFIGKEFYTVDGIKGLTEFVWKNLEACSFGEYIPKAFLPPASDTDTYTSGTQNLDKLKTLVDVVYSPLQIDNQDFRVDTAFKNYIDAKIRLQDTVSKGPFRKFLTALGFNFADVSDEVEKIRYLYDIENTDKENLKYIADLIGFTLRGNNSGKWRHQLRIAADIYKSTGTEESLRRALNALVVNSVLSIDGNIIPLWESYIPHLIWYSLGTASPYFKNLKTWTQEKAKESGVLYYNTSSLEENLKIVTDSILFDLAAAFPDDFRSFGKKMPFPRFYYLNRDGTKGELYTVLGDPLMKPWHGHLVDGGGYEVLRRRAYEKGELELWERAIGPGPFGEGVYMAGRTHNTDPQVDDVYLLFEGDPEFLFNYREKINYPLPPFEEVKYFRDSSVTQPMVDLLVDRLKCFGVDNTFANQVGKYISDNAVTDSTTIGSLNEFLMFFDSPQHPPNYDDVIFSVSDYEKNILSLWNGKSSHIYIDFDASSFDFRKSNLEADSKYALYETARIAQEYTPAHTIPRVNLNASAEDDYLASSVEFLYAALDHDDTRALYGSGTLLGNTAISGVIFEGDRTEKGFQTFQRDDVQGMDTELNSVYNNFNPPPSTPSFTARYIVAHELSSNTIEETKQIAQVKRDQRLQRPYEHIGSLNLSRSLSGAGFISQSWMLGPPSDDPAYIDPSTGSYPPFYRFRSTTQGNVDSNWQSDSGDPFPSTPAGLGFSVSANSQFGGVGADLQLENIRMQPTPVNWFYDSRQYWTKTATGYGGMSSIGNLRNDTVTFPPYNNENNQVIYADQNFKGRDSKHFVIRNFSGEMIVGLAKQRTYDPAVLFSNPVTEASGFYFGAKLDSAGRVTELVTDGDGLSSVSFTTGDGFNIPCNAIRFGVYKGNKYPYVLTSQDNGVNWKLCAFGDRSVDRGNVPQGNPVEFYHLLIKNLDPTGATITATQDPYHVEYGSIAGGSQWTSNVFAINLNDPTTGFGNPYRHYLRPGKFIWRNVEVNGRQPNERTSPWTPIEPLVVNPDMKWGTREYALSSRSFFDCDWSHIKQEHCAYIAGNGDTVFEGCTASSIGSQGFQVSYRSSPYGSFPKSDNNPFDSRPQHLIRDCHMVDCGFEGDRPAFTWTYFTPGNSIYPATITIQDSTIAERYERPIDDSSGDTNGGLSRKTFVATKSQGTSADIFNVPDSEVANAGLLPIPGAYKDQFVRVTNTSSTYRWDEDTAAWVNLGDITGNLMEKVIFQNTAIHTVKQGSSGHMSIRGADTINFEHCAFIYDPEDPNWNNQDYKISIDAEQLDNGVGPLNVSPSGASDDACMQSRYLTLKNNIAVLPANCPDARVIFRVFRTTNRNTGSASNDPVFTFELDATNNLNRVITWDLSSLVPGGGGAQTPTVVEDRPYDVLIDGPYPTAASGSAGVTNPPPVTDPPGKIQNPYPADNAVGIALNAQCAWAPTLNATGYDVYFGEGSLPGTPSLEDTTNAFFDPTIAIPAGLSYNTEYYWRVDTKNVIGTTTGDTLTFTTESAPPPAPGQATNFTPANGATGVSITQSCSWDAATNASAYDVYFGTAPTPPSVSLSQTSTSFDPGLLSYDTTYYWRIDPIGQGGTTTGATISFTTESDPGVPGSAPDEVTVGFPSNVEININPVALVWEAPGNDPSGYDVFFGHTPGSLTQISTDQTSTRIDSSSLSAATTYYWDVTAKNSVGQTPMTSEFSFSTLGLPGEVSAGTPHQITVAPINTVLSWEGVSAADTYKVYLAENVSDLFIEPITEVTGLSVFLGNLKSLTQYYWSVEAVNAFGSTLMAGGTSQGNEEGGESTLEEGTGYFNFITSEVPPSEIIRNDLRRRNFRYLLPEFGYYDRTGFNGPITYDPSVLEMSLASSLGELTLGYVASAGKFFPVEDHTNISGVWDPCEDLDSPNAFFGVNSSSTFPYRGFNSMLSSTEMYADRGQTPEIITAMHSLFENKAKTFAQVNIDASPSSFAIDSYWKDQVQSYANSAIASGYVINSYSDYENFSFGRDMQKVFKNYSVDFYRHNLGPNMREKTGANIFSHVFGKGLFNCDFDIAGENVGSFISTSLREYSPINKTSVWLQDAPGTFVASSLDEAVVPLIGTYTSGESFDFRNGTILSGIEFCDISGAPERNEFQVIHLDPSTQVKGLQNYFVDNPIIKCKSVGGLPRLRFDLSSYGDKPNKLISDHQFKLSLKALVANETKPEFGGGQVGIWIHTEPEQGLIWSWTANGKWTPTNAEDLSIDQVTKKLSNVYSFGLRQPDDDRQYCLASLDSSGSINNKTLSNLRSEFFEEFSVEFDTRNFSIYNNLEYKKIIDKTDEQYKLTDQVHTDRNYIVEVFFIPNNDYRKFLLIDAIELQDTTLRYQAALPTGLGIPTKGIPLRPFVKEYRYELNKEELAKTLKFYNGLIGQRAGENTTPLASRDPNITQPIMGPFGGSRINYRLNPEWVDHTDGLNGNYTEVEFDN